MENNYDRLYNAAREALKIVLSENKGKLPKVYANLLHAVSDVEIDRVLQGGPRGMIGNLVDDSHCEPMLRNGAEKPLDDVFQAAWELYAAYTETALCLEEDGNYGLGGITISLKLDGLMKLFDLIADERIAGKWKYIIDHRNKNKEQNGNWR